MSVEAGYNTTISGDEDDDSDNNDDDFSHAHWLIFTCQCAKP